VSRAYAQQLVLSGAAAVTGASEGASNIANMIGTVTFQLPFSRDQESEADKIGLELMARAGYDPRAALTLWKKMASAESGGTPKFLSTHPAPTDRIQDIEKNLPRVLPLYAQRK
jgi:predicted Zn-dependent protease